MDIYRIPGDITTNKLYQENSDMSYMLVKVPQIGASVELSGMPDKMYSILSCQVMYEESGMSGIATLLQIDPETGEDVGNDTIKASFADLTDVS